MSAEWNDPSQAGWSPILFRDSETENPVPKEKKTKRRVNTTQPEWFNPSTLTDAKRSWLKQNKGEKEEIIENTPERLVADAFTRDAFESDDEGKSPDSYEQTDRDDNNDRGEKYSIIESPFERFYVCGLPWDADVTATAVSKEAAQLAQKNGSDFLVAGPKTKKPHRGASGVTHPAQVLYEYTPDGEGSTPSTSSSTLNTPTSRKKKTISLPNVADFCFPDGVATKLLERTNSMSAVHDLQCGTGRTPGAPGGGVEANDRSFVFSIGGGDDNDDYSENENSSKSKKKSPSVVWGVCVYAEELVRREPFIVGAFRQVEERKMQDKYTEVARTVSGNTDDSGMSKQSDDDASKIKINQLQRKLSRERYLVTADRCYCFLSKRPVFEWHFEMLRAMVQMERLQRVREVADEMVMGMGEVDVSGGGGVGVDDDDDSRADAPNDTSTSDDIPMDIMQTSDAFRILQKYEHFDVRSTSHKLGGKFSVSTESVEQQGVFSLPKIINPMTFPGEFFDQRDCDVYKNFSNVTKTHRNVHSGNIKSTLTNLDCWNTAVLCRVLSLETILTVMTAVLLERRVVVAHPNLGELSAITIAISHSLLRPMKWTSLVLPVLPETMFDFLDAPVPFIVGVRRKTSETRSACAQPGVVRLNAYKDDVKVCVKKGAGALPSLPGKSELLKALRPSFEACRDSAKKAEQLGAPFPYSLSIQGDQGDGQGDSADESEQSQEDANNTHANNPTSFKKTQLFGDLSYRKSSARGAARDARRAAKDFMDTWRDYLGALVGPESLKPHSITEVTASDKVTVLMRDSFIEQFSAGDRVFAKQLTETQMFEKHVDCELSG